MKFYEERKTEKISLPKMQFHKEYGMQCKFNAKILNEKLHFFHSLCFIFLTVRIKHKLNKENEIFNQKI